MRLRWFRHTVGLVFVVSTLLVVPRPADAASGFKVVGTLERFPQVALHAFPELFQGSPFESRMLNGTLLPVPEAGQLWQVFRATAFNRSGVLVRDADNLRVIRTFRLDTLLRRTTFSIGYGGEWLHARDGAGRVFLVDMSYRLWEVDTTTLVVRHAGALSVSESVLGGSDPLVVGGMTWDPVSRQLLVLYGGPPNSTVANRITVLQQFDPATGTRANRVVRSCTGPLPATDFTGDTLATRPMADTDSVYVPCQRDTYAPGFGLLSSSIVVRLPRATLSEPAGNEASVVVGGPMDTAVPDSVAGRMTVLDEVGRLTTVDVRSMAVVGSFDASPGGSGRVGLGLAPDTGRLFFQSDLGLGYVDVRAAAPLVPTFDQTSSAEAQESIVTSGNRLYVLTGQALEKAESYKVYKVTG